MEPNISTFDIQQAWQTAFLLRTCPSDAVLRSTVPDENLTRHLASCALCREKRAMPAEETGAWQKLFNAFAPQVHKAVNKPQAGQVWVLKKELARWGNDGYFYAPPNVLLLDVPEDTQNMHVAQLYTDKRLMGDGDFWLGDQFGFAQSWNCYSIPRNALECWLGTVSESLVSEVATSAATNMQPPTVDSIISFFREMETAVGLSAVQALEAEPAEVVDKSIIDLLPGLKLAIGGTKEFVLDITMETLELLRATFRPALVLRGGPAKPSAATLPDEQKKLIQENCQVIPIELKVSGDNLTVAFRWLQGRPSELPIIIACVNGVKISTEGIDIVSSDRITISHDIFSHITTSHISRLRIEYVGNILTFNVTTEQ